MDLLQRQLPGGGWAGDAQLLVPAQADDRLPTPTTDARGAYTTATVLYAAVALLRALPPAPSGSADAARSHPHALSGMTLIPGPRAGDATGPAGRDERWDAVIARAAEGGGIPPERGLEVFRALTRESLAAHSPWPSPQLSSLASGTPVELLAGPVPGLRFLCEVGDPRLPAPARLRSGLRSVEWTAQLLGMGEAWAGRRAQLLDSLADPHLPVPDGCRFWLRAEVELPADGSPVLTAHLSLHAGDVDDWRSRLHTALRMLPSGGSIWPALACLRGAGRCHELGIGEMPGDRWGTQGPFRVRPLASRRRQRAAGDLRAVRVARRPHPGDPRSDPRGAPGPPARGDRAAGRSDDG